MDKLLVTVKVSGGLVALVAEPETATKKVAVGLVKLFDGEEMEPITGNLG